MAINPDFAGRTFPPGEPYEVSREKLREFAKAIGDPNPVYRDRAAAQEAGFPDVIAPPTFAIVISMASSFQVLAEPDLNVNYAMVVHGEQKFEYTRPLQAGDVVTAQSTITNIREVGSLSMMTTTTRLTTRRRRAHLHGSLDDRGTGRLMSDQITYDQVEVGAEIAEVSYPATRLSLVMYCGASGDFNVIHWNERIAKSVGLPDVIAHGMFTMAQAGRFVTDWAGPKAIVVEFGVRFSAPVVVPDDDTGAAINVTGKVEEKLDGNRVALALTARSAGTKVLSRARAVVRLP